MLSNLPKVTEPVHNRTQTGTPEALSLIWWLPHLHTGRQPLPPPPPPSLPKMTSPILLSFSQAFFLLPPLPRVAS